MPAQVIQLEDLLELAEELRGAGFDLGTQQYVAAQDLLIAMAAHGHLYADPRAWRTLLAPVFCSSPVEQEDFYQRFDGWLNRHPALMESVEQVQSSTGYDTEQKVIQNTAFERLVPVANNIIKTRSQTLSAQLKQTKVRLPFIAIILFQLFVVFLALRTLTRSSLVVTLLWGVTIWLVLFALWYVWRFYQRQMMLQKLQAKETPSLFRVSVKGAAEHLFQSPQFRRVVQGLHRHHQTQVHELDVAATVRATIQCGGLFTPAYGIRQVLPEYLLLIDRASVHDEQARMGEELGRRLEAGGVFVDCYYFQGDARTCRRLEPLSPTFTLSDLAARYPDHRLLVFGDGAGFFDQFTGAPHNWIDLFTYWKERTLLTPEAPAQWGYREWTLAEHEFLILPANESGLAALTELLHTSVAPSFNGMPAKPPFPELIAERPKRWLERHAPQPVVIEQLCSQLHEYLDEDGWYWLSACAIYPQVTWDITLYIGYKLFGSLEEIADRLLMLVRLPWFRYGTMPDWLRKPLIDSLTREQERKVREVIEVMLLSVLENPQEGIQLEIAKEQDKTRDTDQKRLLWRLNDTFLKWSKRSRLNSFISIESPESPLQDYVFLNFMSGRYLSRLAVKAPEILHRALSSQGQANLGTAQEDVQKPISQETQEAIQGDIIEEAESLHERLASKNRSWRQGFYLYVRRLMDVLLAAVGCGLSLPVMSLIAIAIKLDSRGPIFYTQERVGIHNRVFRIIKFRSMQTDADRDGPAWVSESDPRVTRVGRIIRKLRLDELPQLINVILGDMSFIGPRPERPVFVEQLEREIPYYSQRHMVKPGLTGWAQIRYPYGASLEDAIEKLQYDLYYIENQSPVLDMIIIFETVRIVLFGRGAR